MLASRGVVVRDAQGGPQRLLGTCLDVTEARQAVREAEAAEQRLQLILDSVEEGIFGLDREGAITFANRAAADLLGTSPSAMLGRRCHAVMGPHASDGTPHAEGESLFERTGRDGRPRGSAHEQFCRHDGTRFPVACGATPIRDAEGATVGAVVSFRDLTRQRRAEEEARSALESLLTERAARTESELMRGRLARIFEQAPALVAVLRGPDHVFEMTNAAMDLVLLGRRVSIDRSARPFPKTTPAPPSSSSTRSIGPDARTSAASCRRRSAGAPTARSSRATSTTSISRSSKAMATSRVSSSTRSRSPNRSWRGDRSRRRRAS